MQVYSLYELNRYIRQALALNFAQPVWITAEIAQSGLSRGHRYFDLVQKGEYEDPLAQAQAVLWANDYKKLSKTIGPQLDVLLQEGIELKIRIQVDFHERYGLKLQILEIDPEFTFGKLNLQRRDSIARLRQEGLLERNRMLPFPHVVQRIAIISSETAAGLQDFEQHLLQNPYGYKFKYQLFNTAMQGKNAPGEIAAAAQAIAAQAHEYDVVAILRGGGAKLDLAAFDAYTLCAAMAQLPLPVLAGIGHDVDETVLDLVAKYSLKTPTAVADFLVQHNLKFEQNILLLAQQTAREALAKIRFQSQTLQETTGNMRWAAQNLHYRRKQQLEQTEQEIPKQIRQYFNKQVLLLTQAEQLMRAVHPDAVLKRGYSITTKNGELLRSPYNVISGDLLETRLHDGVLKSRVE
ncbi:MAG: exodeoxyribonuclease VII large subunit [Bacteroidetes bacterium]|nr:exodeoxyribonuclease VII large subunit [Bacteroidota bacterium]